MSLELPTKKDLEGKLPTTRLDSFTRALLTSKMGEHAKEMIMSNLKTTEAISIYSDSDRIEIVYCMHDCTDLCGFLVSIGFIYKGQQINSVSAFDDMLDCAIEKVLDRWENLFADLKMMPIGTFM